MGLSCLCLGLPASAHISLEQGGTHLSRYGAYLKAAPCGVSGGTRGTHIYTYAPGQKITVKFKETVPHPSYFRFAFDNDGDNDFKEPASIKPIDPARPCPYNLADKCGKSDFYNSPTVLPGMDNLEPHLAAQTKGTYTFQVTLPNVECNNCTLQLIQVMQDTSHGAYNPFPGDPNDTPYVADIYHQCIDLILKRSNSDAGADARADGASADGSADADGASEVDASIELDASPESGGPADTDGSMSSDSGEPATNLAGTDDAGCDCTLGGQARPASPSGLLALLIAALSGIAARRRERHRR